MSPIRTSLVSTLAGWFVAFAWWVAVDIIYPHPHPPSDDTLDYVFIDVVLAVCGSPVALALGVVLWGFCALSSTPRLWHAPLWSLCGGFLGSELCSLFVSPWIALPVWPWCPGSFSPASLDWGALAGLVAFAFAFALRYRMQIVFPHSVPAA